MREQIKKLIELQQIDSEIHELSEEKEGKPFEFEAEKQKLEQKKTKLKELQGELKSVEVERKNLEIELESKQTNVAKYESQLFQIRTNKEYNALQKEINGLRADNSLIEDKILELLEKIDTINNDIAKEKEALKTEEDTFLEFRKRYEAQLERLKEELEGFNKKREDVVPLIEPKTLAAYERILKNKDGLALVRVEDGACQGCFMSLPPQTINNLRMSKHLVACENCTRLLYLET